MKGKIFLLVLFCLLAAGCFNGPAYAASPPPEDEMEREAVIKSTLYLSSWDCSIAKIKGNTVAITGFSEATKKVDKIWVKIYLQKWNGSKWIDISSGYYQEKKSNSSVNASQNLKVTGGNYYRTRSQHQCIKGGAKDPATPVECV